LVLSGVAGDARKSPVHRVGHIASVRSARAGTGRGDSPGSLRYVRTITGSGIAQAPVAERPVALPPVIDQGGAVSWRCFSSPAPKPISKHVTHCSKPSFHRLVCRSAGSARGQALFRLPRRPSGRTQEALRGLALLIARDVVDPKRVFRCQSHSPVLISALSNAPFFAHGGPACLIFGSCPDPHEFDWPQMVIMYRWLCRYPLKMTKAGQSIGSTLPWRYRVPQ
jgi:hypothetical protein